MRQWPLCITRFFAYALTGALMLLSQCYRILGIESDATAAGVKDAYHRQAKKHHPDLSMENDNQLKMMKINEAYLTVVSERFSDRSAKPLKYQETSDSVDYEITSELKSVGFLKDPAYTYYKLGFSYYTMGRKTFFDRYKIHGHRIRYLLDNKEILRLAITCIGLFQRSYSYFSKIKQNYPESIWYRDSLNKIYFLERYNEIYLRICESISNQMSD